MSNLKSLAALSAVMSALALATVSATSLPGAAQEPVRLDGQALKTMISNLGFETKELVKEPGKEKYEIKLAKDSLDIPVGIEVSPSKNYVWLTVFLGEKAIEGSRALDLLKQNGKNQPTQFYVTSTNKLMVGLAIENRDLTPAWLRKNIEKVTSDVANSKSVWQ